ncbi:MAG: stage III sporulation protein AF [Lachnospira sp.]
MFDSVINWAKQIFLFGIFENIILNILPKNSYEKIISVILKVLMVIIVIQPLITFLGVDDILSSNYDELTSLYEKAGLDASKNLGESTIGFDEKILSLSGNDIAENIKKIVEKYDLCYRSCEVSFSDYDSNNLRIISKITLYISLNGGKSSENQSDNFKSEIKRVEIEQVEIERIDVDSDKNSVKKNNYGEQVYNLTEEIKKIYSLEDSQLEIIVKE